MYGVRLLIGFGQVACVHSDISASCRIRVDQLLVDHACGPVFFCHVSCLWIFMLVDQLLVDLLKHSSSFFAFSSLQLTNYFVQGE